MSPSSQTTQKPYRGITEFIGSIIGGGERTTRYHQHRDGSAGSRRPLSATAISCGGCMSDCENRCGMGAAQKDGAACECGSRGQAD
jgi:hypothetical protein